MPNGNGKDISIDLNRLSKEKILRMCIQTPYLPKQEMEEKIWRKNWINNR